MPTRISANDIRYELPPRTKKDVLGSSFCLYVISAVYCIIAAADFAYQKVKFTMDMRMTKQEVKDEYKEQEG